MKKGLLLTCLVCSACSNAPQPNVRSIEPYERYLGALEEARTEGTRETQKLLGDAHWFARDGAVVALGRLGDPSFTPQVVDLTFERVAPAGASPEEVARYNRSNDPLLRADACRVLAQLKDARGVPALMSALRGDASLEVRRTAALALEAFPDHPEVLKVLVEAVGDREASVAHNAHQVLVRVSRQELPRERAAWEDWLKRRSS